jgi:hypothetical protein
MSPGRAERIVLVEQVVFAFLVDEAVGIIHEVPGRREMKSGAERFPILLRRA